MFVSLNKSISEFINEIKKDKLAIAVSGGPDSVALAILCHKLNRGTLKDIIALHVDHKLRDSSTKESLNVKKIMENSGIKCEILTWEHNNIKTCIQEKAREARYDLLLNYCEKNNISNIAFAHHKNDQAETFLMRLFKGSGIKGLCCMQKARKAKYGDTEINIHRPLINSKKDELINFLKINEISFIEDPSNENEKFNRVRFRKFLQKNKDYICEDGIAKTIEKLNKSLSFEERAINSSIKKYQINSNFPIKISNDLIKNEDIHIQVITIQKIISMNSKNKYMPNYDSCEKIINNLHLNRASTIQGLLVKKNKNYIYITKENRKNNTAL